MSCPPLLSGASTLCPRRRLRSSRHAKKIPCYRETLVVLVLYCTFIAPTIFWTTLQDGVWCMAYTTSCTTLTLTVPLRIVHGVRNGTVASSRTP